MTIDRNVSDKTKVTISFGDWLKVVVFLVFYTAVGVYGVERRASSIEAGIRDHELRITRVEKQADASDTRTEKIMETLADIRASIARIEERTRKP